ncbi:hypothetical protein EV363DRAFT_1558324 [Boletus edulis]|nr:hypothetical protein EV363DRAFT_1558324 [Boletus edulis]
MKRCDKHSPATFEKYGIGVKFVHGDAPRDFQAAIDEKTKAIYVESIGNPKYNVAPLPEIAKVGLLDLERSIAEFEQALDTCPLDHPCRAAAQSNLAMATLIFCQVGDMFPSVEIPIRLHRDALAARPVGHTGRPSTLVQLAAVYLARFEKQRDGVDGARVEWAISSGLGFKFTVDRGCIGFFSPFVFLPIHDAEYSAPGHKVFDFVVSSYVLTLSILVQSNRRVARSSDLRTFLVGALQRVGSVHL